MTPDLEPIEAKPFVPAKDYAQSKRFYEDFGFEIAWSDAELTCFRKGNAAFLLQNFYEEVHAKNFMMHLLVEDADAWWHRMQESRLAIKYAVRARAPEDRPWGLRDFVIVDPTGVLWRVGHRLDRRTFTIAGETG